MALCKLNWICTQQFFLWFSRLGLAQFISHNTVLNCYTRIQVTLSCRETKPKQSPFSHQKGIKGWGSRETDEGGKDFLYCPKSSSDWNFKRWIPEVPFLHVVYFLFLTQNWLYLPHSDSKLTVLTVCYSSSHDLLIS